ncbi:hypothetical protein [Gordonia sp. N1V]|uniref:hypothetical protein n=1 Tax=Gordonia sp. N1V TaxID=3034163 RepID=UPI0023E28C35|nr:hypothetical protein [Gordonia sp. N1V]MDF3280922.1 hypothetical protein [Gordonia sp. N1V]
MFINTEELLVAYLTPLLTADQVSTELPNEPPLPFILVTRIAATDDKVTELAMADVEFFANSRDSANDLARQGHSRMLSLSPKTPVVTPSGTVWVDWVRTDQGPAWQDYADEDLDRYVARYEIASRINSQPL